jgi:hypothetical protein
MSRKAFAARVNATICLNIARGTRLAALPNRCLAFQ